MYITSYILLAKQIVDSVSMAGLLTYPGELMRIGFYNILMMVLRLRPGGLLVGGPPCGSYIWINRSTSKRSKTRPFGDGSRAYVKAANAILSSTINIVFMRWFYLLMLRNNIWPWLMDWLIVTAGWFMFLICVVEYNKKKWCYQSKCLIYFRK